MSQPDLERALVAGINLANESATAQIVTALRKAGIASVVLKGPSLRRWLHGGEAPHPSMDVDLLVPWSSLGEIDDVLLRLDWRYLGISALGHDRPHRRVWEQSASGMLLELHRSLAGVGVSPNRAWEILATAAEEAAVGGVEVTVLDSRARAMHVALHAAQHGSGMERTLEDLATAVDRLPRRTWEEAAALAGQLDALPAFSAGLRLLPIGQELLARLGVERSATVDVELRASSAPPMSQGLAHLSGLPGWREKGRFALRHLFPPAGYMKVWLPMARRGALGLAAGYLWRPVWLTLHLGPALRAFWRARR